MSLQKPVFPPDEVNYSLEALEASRAHLDPETIALLDLDRARLNQATAMAALALGEGLGLSDDTTNELAEKLNQRLNRMSPAYHQYIGLLIGNVSVAVNSQEGAVSSRLNVVNTVTEAQPKLPEAQPAFETHSSNGSSPVSTPTETISTDRIEESGQATETPSLYNPEDILSLTDDFMVIEYEKPIRGLKKFVKDVFPEDVSDIDQLSVVELALVGYQLIEIYMSTEIPQATPSRKANQKERMELFFGFNGSYANIDEVCDKLDLTSASFYLGLKRVRVALADIIGSDFERIATRAKTTAEYGDLRLVSQNQYQAIQSEDTKTKQHEEVTVEASGRGEIDYSRTTPSRDQAETVSPLAELIDDLPPLHKHYQGTPANMRNFLYEVFPPDYERAITGLSTDEAGLLVQLLAKKYSEIPVTGLSSEAMKERILYLEQWTGLYDTPREYSEIARRRNKTTSHVNNSIASSLSQLNRSISERELKEMFDAARSASRRPSESPNTA